MVLSFGKLVASRQRKHGQAAYIPDIKCSDEKDLEVAIDVFLRIWL